MAGGRNGKERTRILERRSRAVALRKQGASYEAIAKTLAKEFNQPSYRRCNAHKDVDMVLSELAEQCSHDAEALRALELERLDQWQLSIAKDIQRGDIKAIETALKISERRCKLLGVDAPIQIKVEEGIQSELTAFLESLQSALDQETFKRVLVAFDTLQARSRQALAN